MATSHDRVVDPPRFPRAPSHAAWEAMTPAQRAAVVEALPEAMTVAELPREERRLRLEDAERRLEESEARVRALEAELAHLRGG